jgi:hypothetical protein
MPVQQLNLTNDSGDTLKIECQNSHNNNTRFGIGSLPGDPAQGTSNIAIGNESFTDTNTDTSFKENVAVGHRAFWKATKYNGVAVGHAAGAKVTGAYNTSVGSHSNNTCGWHNVGMGYRSNFRTIGSRNIAIGSEANGFNKRSDDNIAIGHFTMKNRPNTENQVEYYQSTNNVCIGNGIEVGDNGENVVVGNSSGGFGARNVVVGYNSTITSGNGNNIILGSNTTVDGANVIAIGNNMNVPSADDAFFIDESLIESLPSDMTNIAPLYINTNTGQLYRG